MVASGEGLQGNNEGNRSPGSEGNQGRSEAGAKASIVLSWAASPWGMLSSLQPHIIAARFALASPALIGPGEDDGAVLKRARQEPGARPVQAGGLCPSDLGFSQGRGAS